MTVEYDLIVIGGSRVAVDAAVTAAHLNARVALVASQAQQIAYGDYTALTQLGRVAKQVQSAAQVGIHCQTDQAMPLIDITEAMQWSNEVISTSLEQNSPAILAALGVDIINGTGEFCRRPYLGFVVNNRRLRARGYLIATGYRPIIPEIEGLQIAGYVTPETWQQDVSQLPHSWVVIGNGAIAIQFAQILTRLNCQVTLVVSSNHILPDEDLEALTLIQAQLEAEGVRILTESIVTQVRKIDDKKWVQAGNQAIETDEIMVAIGQQPQLETLNLEGVGVKFDVEGIKLNQKLQTTNPRIYACNFQQDHIAQHEVSLAVKNVLFAPIFKVNYGVIPRVVFGDPQLARVGLTEAQARGRYGKDVLVARQYFKSLDKAQILGETTGFCKIVALHNGTILGAAIVGQEASELISAIAFCLKNKLKVNAIADLPFASPTLSEIVRQTAIEWQRQRLSHNQRLRNALDWFFDWRRNWSS